MEIREIPLDRIQPPFWNPNRMDEATFERLRHSVQRFGLLVPIVVRPLLHDCYETVGGAQRLHLLSELKVQAVQCVVVEVDDTEARLLAQSLNRIAGEDDLGLRAELVRHLLEKLPQDELLELLPETVQSLQALESLGQEDVAQHLQAWQEAQHARLQHLHVQLTRQQLEVVEKALSIAVELARGGDSENPNLRGNALYLLCKAYVESEGNS